MTQAYDRLQELLEELFQFDRENLDFGIYRTMNQKRAEVLRFLDKDLEPQVEDAFNEYWASDDEAAREELATLERTLKNAGVSAEYSPKYVALKNNPAQTEDLTALENEVYSDLYTFLRRYKPGVYAIPYEGEEVKLHWTNADQYYMMTAENFRNYRYGLKGGGGR